MQGSAGYCILGLMKWYELCISVRGRNRGQKLVQYKHDSSEKFIVNNNLQHNCALSQLRLTFSW